MHYEHRAHVPFLDHKAGGIDEGDRAREVGRFATPEDRARLVEEAEERQSAREDKASENFWQRISERIES